MFFLENHCDLTNEQINFLQYVLSDKFSWFFQKEKIEDDRLFYFLVHTLMHRNQEKLPVEGDINSPYYDICIDIFRNFCAKNNIAVNTIFRAAINCTLYNSELNTRIHTDHEFEHKNFILYINEFSNGATCIFDREHKLLREVTPQLHQAFVFSGEPHAHKFCLPNQRRIILVVTFN